MCGLALASEVLDNLFESHNMPRKLIAHLAVIHVYHTRPACSNTPCHTHVMGYRERLALVSLACCNPLMFIGRVACSQEGSFSSNFMLPRIDHSKVVIVQHLRKCKGVAWRSYSIMRIKMAEPISSILHTNLYCTDVTEVVSTQNALNYMWKKFGAFVRNIHLLYAA